MVETPGVDLKACVYLEIATRLALRRLLEKMPFPSGNCSLGTRKRGGLFESPFGEG
jgi:hypothetical protein